MKKHSPVIISVLGLVIALLLLWQNTNLDKKLKLTQGRIDGLVENQTQNPPPNSLSEATAQIDPDYYSAYVAQVGGVGSGLISKFAMDDEGGFINKDEYILESFNRPRDLLWVSCKDGYKASTAKSSTGGKPFYDDVIGYGLEIKEQYKNDIDVVCKKIK